MGPCFYFKAVSHVLAECLDEGLSVITLTLTLLLGRKLYVADVSIGLPCTTLRKQ